MEESLNIYTSVTISNQLPIIISGLFTVAACTQHKFLPVQNNDQLINSLTAINETEFLTATAEIGTYDQAVSQIFNCQIFRNPELVTISPL